MPSTETHRNLISRLRGAPPRPHHFLEMRTGPKKDKYIPVKADDLLHSRLMEIARTLNVDRSDLIRRYIAQGLDADEARLKTGQPIHYYIRGEPPDRLNDKKNKK